MVVIVSMVYNSNHSEVHLVCGRVYRVISEIAVIYVVYDIHETSVAGQNLHEFRNELNVDFQPWFKHLLVSEWSPWF